MISGLKAVLANSYALLARTHVYHWNVEGPTFFALHQAFEEQYTELFEAVDVIAERIRTYGAYAPGGLKLFDTLASMSDPDLAPSSNEMLADLIQAHEALKVFLQETLEAAQKVGDEATLDLMVERLRVHDKTIWMLRSQLAS